MNLMKWQRPTLPSVGRLADLRDELDRLFEAPFAGLGRASQLLTGWTPALDVHETKDNFIVRAELPGMKREEIDVSLHEGVLSISGERKTENIKEEAEVYRSERFYGKFQRSVTLPTSVAGDKVEAKYKDGILTITLPKTEEAKRKQINVTIS